MNDYSDYSEDHISCGNKNMKVGMDESDYEKSFLGFDNMITHEDWIQFLQHLENPPHANEKLKEGFKEYYESIKPK